MASRFGSQALVEHMLAVRVLAESHMRAFDAEGEAWAEPTITDLLLSMASPVARFVKFNTVEEGEIGADWIWWWIDETTGEAFGAIVQAKRLKQKSSHWWIDFAYKKDAQRNNLEWVARYFEVVPLYMLYLGTPEYRAGAFCRADTHTSDCDLCSKSTLSTVPSVLTRIGLQEPDETQFALQNHVSLEELVDPSVDPGTYWSPDFSGASDEFVRFLSEPQTGARQIARTIVDQIRSVRQGMFTAPEAELTAVRSDAIFPDLPEDRGHFPVPYFPHALRGLRTAAPDYVRRFLSTGEALQGLSEFVGGLAVFIIPSAHVESE